MAKMLMRLVRKWKRRLSRRLQNRNKSLKRWFGIRCGIVTTPEIPVNIVDLGLIYACNVYKQKEGSFKVEVRMTLTAPGCGMGGVLQQDVETRLKSLAGVKETDVQLVFDPPWDRNMMSESARLELGLM